MGNKLCCDAHALTSSIIQNQTQIDAKINNFFKAHQKFRSVIEPHQPGALYHRVQRKAKKYDNGTYVGSLVDGKRVGYGLMMFQTIQANSEAMYYQGQWLNDNFSGRGKFIFSDGSFYEGYWHNGLPHGEGLYINQQQKWRYQGQWQKGSQNGKGKQTFEDSSYYEGEFKKGLRHGKGIFQNHDRSYYKGTFVEGQMQGHFKVYNHNYIYEGQFKAGKLAGAGKSQWYKQKQPQKEQQKSNKKNKSDKKVDLEKQLEVQYIGQYKQGCKNGFGQYREKNGVTFKGNWKDGYIENKGIFIQQPKL